MCVAPSPIDLSGPEILTNQLNKTSTRLHVNVCMHGALQWTGIPFRMHSLLVPSVPGISSGFTSTLTGINPLLKMNKWINDYTNVTSCSNFVFLFINLPMQDLNKHWNREHILKLALCLSKSSLQYCSNLQTLETPHHWLVQWASLQTQSFAIPPAEKQIQKLCITA